MPSEGSQESESRARPDSDNASIHSNYGEKFVLDVVDHIKSEAIDDCNSTWNFQDDVDDDIIDRKVASDFVGEIVDVAFLRLAANSRSDACEDGNDANQD